VPSETVSPVAILAQAHWNRFREPPQASPVPDMPATSYCECIGNNCEYCRNIDHVGAPHANRGPNTPCEGEESKWKGFKRCAGCLHSVSKYGKLPVQPMVDDDGFEMADLPRGLGPSRSDVVANNCWTKVRMPIVEIDAHLRRQGYDPSTGLPVGITQQEFDARNSQYQEIAALQRPKKKLRRE